MWAYLATEDRTWRVRRSLRGQFTLFARPWRLITHVVITDGQNADSCRD